MDNVQRKKLIDLATSFTIDLLFQYGNNPNDEHIKALKQIITGFVYLLEHKNEKLAFPLFCGGGKSTCIRGFLRALHELNIDYGVVVSATQVEALCELKTALLYDNIPIDKIGLIHSKLSASIPSDTKEQAGNKQFVLVTHNKMKHQKTDITSYFFYKENKRDLVIWDESLIAGHSTCISTEKIRASIAVAKVGFEDRIVGNESEIDYIPLMQYLYSIDKSLIEAKSSENSDFKITFEEIPANLNCIKSKLKYLLGEDEKLNLFIEYINIINHIRYIKEQNGSIIYFEQALPDELDSIVVLDASHVLRELTQSDPSIQTIQLACSKVYEGLIINYFKNPCGRGSLEKQFKNRSNSNLVKEVINIICSILENHQEEPILIWSYKEKNSLNIIDGIKTELRQIYPDLNYEQTNSHGQKILNFQTFGNELGLNSLAHCKHTVFCGLLYQPTASLAMTLKGLSGDMERDVYKNSLLYKTTIKEQAHIFYQAVSRGSSRETIEGNCLDHSVYFFHSQPEQMKSILDDVFPGAKWLRYDAKYLDNTTSLAYQRAVKIDNQLSLLTDEEFLSLCGVNGKSLDKVSTQKIRKHMLPELKDNEWKQVAREFNDNEFLDWMIEGRSFKMR
ncbi:MAG: hypothetical protein C0446_13735 [Chitinophaga sp.]|nr:hypothetical protein [Chitinophaga sp.]